MPTLEGGRARKANTGTTSSAIAGPRQIDVLKTPSGFAGHAGEGARSLSGRPPVPDAPDPFDLNWRHLWAVSAITDLGTMNAAAEAVSLTQPALTQGVAKLERRLGKLLFHRQGVGMVPTNEGVCLSKRVVAAFDHLATAARIRTHGRGFVHAERLMTATQLRAILALADAGGFIPGARMAGISEPAMHRSVRELEQILADTLVIRRGRGVTLTDFGRHFARAARLAWGEVACAISEICEPHDQVGSVVVGTMPLCRAHILPTAVSKFLMAEPRARISIIEAPWRDLVQRLRDGRIDVMIGAFLIDPAPSDLDQTPLLEDRLVVVARAAHPVFAEPDIGSQTLASYPWIVGPAQSPARQQWEALFGRSDHSAARIECGSVATIRNLLCDGDFLALLSPSQIALEVSAGILRHVGEPLVATTRVIGVTTRSGWRPTRLQSSFLDLLGRDAQAAVVSSNRGDAAQG